MLRILDGIRKLFCTHKFTITKFSDDRTLLYVECLRCGWKSPGIICPVDPPKERN